VKSPSVGLRPIITVQLCTYNRRALLGRVLAALFQQDLRSDDYEIVLVDDGSNDGTYEDVLRQLRPPCAFYLVRQRRDRTRSWRVHSLHG